MPIEEQLRFSIGNKLLIQASYDGSTRLTEPHDDGVQKGSQKLLAYQLRHNGGAPGKAVSGWRRVAWSVDIIDPLYYTPAKPRGDARRPRGLQFRMVFLPRGEAE